MGHLCHPSVAYTLRISSWEMAESAVEDPFSFFNDWLFGSVPDYPVTSMLPASIVTGKDLTLFPTVRTFVKNSRLDVVK